MKSESKTEKNEFRTTKKIAACGMILGLLLLGSVTHLQASDPCPNGDPLTFSRALDMMVARNEAILSAASEVEQKQYEARATRGLNLPRVTMSGEFARISDSIDLDLDGIRNVILALHPEIPSAAVPSFYETIQEDTLFVSQLNATWPVYTGGKIKAAKRAADAAIRESEAKLRRTEDTLASELAQYYFSVRLAGQVYKIRNEVLDALNIHLYQARRLQEEGFIARTEVLHAQVAHAQAERELKASRRDLELAELALANILAADRALTPSTPLFLLESVDPEASFISQARLNHPALDQLQAVQDKAGENLRAAKSELYPTVFLFGTREIYERNLTDYAPSWAVGAGINFTLFDGRARANKILAARKMEDQAGLMRRKVARDLATLVSSRYQAMMKASEQYDSLQASLDLAEENLRARKRSFEEGMATSLDVVDAQLSLSAIQVERMQAAYSFDVTLAQLLEACGRGIEFPRYLDGAIMEVEH